MRAIWKGHIRFSLVTIPIRIYSAIDAASSISFNLLSKEGKNPVKYEKRDKITGDVLKADDIVKGYQYAPDQYVIIDAEDFKKVKLKSTKVIEIEGFVKKEEVHHTLFDTPYFAGPDGEVAQKTYNLLRKTLEQSGKVGVGKVVLRDREHVVLLTPHKEGILLYKLRQEEEVRDISAMPGLENTEEVDKEQMKRADMLVNTMSKKFSDIDTTDRYTTALREMIDAKIKGEEVVTVGEMDEPVVDIMTALKESIARAKASQKPMKKAEGKSESKSRKTG